MNFIFRYALKFRLFQYLYREFGGRSYDVYPCLTCRLSDTVDPVDD